MGNESVWQANLSVRKAARAMLKQARAKNQCATHSCGACTVVISHRLDKGQYDRGLPSHARDFVAQGLK